MIRERERQVFAVIIEFLVSLPSDDELLAYHLPEDLQERLSDLLKRNSEVELTGDEREELDDFIHADNMISLLKTKIRLRQRGLG
ncbi:MAG: hypothetical protein J4G18_15475 [Anaerolineae bacterium]|nr:hypothetical protein [Anaerolineae bacterium]